MPFSNVHTIILAGGRIRGGTPTHSKGLVSLDGKPAVWYLLKTLSDLNVNGIDIVFTREDFFSSEDDKNCFKELKNHFGQCFGHFERLGHGKPHNSLTALLAGLQDIKGRILKNSEIKYILVLCGDVPLIQYSDFEGLLKQHEEDKYRNITLMCVGRRNPFNYGIIYKEEGKFKVFESKEFERYLLQIRKGTSETGERLIEIIKKIEPERGSEGRYLNNVGPILFSKSVLEKNDTYEKILKTLSDWTENHQEAYYTRILNCLPSTDIDLYTVSPREETSTIGFDSYYEYIGTSARIKYLKDKYERKLTENLLIKQFKDLYKSIKKNKFDIDEITKQIGEKEDKGDVQGTTYDILKDICNTLNLTLTNFQMFLISFIKDYESYKKDLIEIIFDNLRHYQGVNNFEIDIIKKLDEFRDYEVILYKNKSYRDHLIHVFQVFLLGMYIMEKIRLSPYRKSRLAKLLRNSAGCDELYMLWYYASLYHDICYPMEKASESIQTIAYKFLVEDLVGDIKHPKRKRKPNPFSAHIIMQPDMQPNVFDFNNCVYNFVKTSYHLSDKPEAKTLLCGKLTELFYKTYDHGIASAINLCHLIYRFKKDRKHLSEDKHSPKNERVIYKAILAIALHTIRVIKKIDEGKDDDFSGKTGEELRTILNNNNMLRLLIFCDNVQEWGRPDGNFSKDTDEEVKLANIEVDTNNKEVKVTISCKDDEKKTKLEDNKRLLDNFLQKGGIEQDWTFSYEIE